MSTTGATTTPASPTTERAPTNASTISDPEGRFGLTNLGLPSVDTLGEAVAVAAIGLALAPLALLLARGCATAHVAVDARILRPSPHAWRGSLNVHTRGEGHVAAQRQHAVDART